MDTFRDQSRSPTKRNTDLPSPQLEVTLPNGQRVRCLGKREALLVYEQVRQYFDFDIVVEKGATVFDVGANIGLFSLLVKDMCEGEVNIYAFEPIPATYNALTTNLNMYATGQITAIQCGLAAEAGDAVFEYYPLHSVLSTVHHDPHNLEEMREQLKDSILRNLAETPKPLSWLRFFPSSIRSFAVERLTRRTFENAEKVHCKLRTVSEIIREHDIANIDLLKVDVEKSELEVLQGINPEHWPRIQQVVLELHDLDNRLEIVRHMLITHGLEHIYIEQEPALRGSNVYALFASRN